MTVTLTPELEQIVNEQIAGGQFTSPEQVVEVSLKFLRQQYEELKASIAEGMEDIAQGRVAPFDPGAVLARVKARRAAKQENEPCGG
jgi:putative addiction module CopG family antidote